MDNPSEASMSSGAALSSTAASVRRRPWCNSPLLVGVLLLGAVALSVATGRYAVKIRPIRQHLYQGMEFIRQGKGPEAEREWKEALRLDPLYPAAWELLGEYYASAARWEEARDAWDKVRRLAPRQAHVLCQLAQASDHTGDEVKAWKLAEQEIQSDSRCVRALTLATRIADQLGDAKKALDYLRRATEEKPNDPALLVRLVEYLVAVYQYREARAVAERLIRLSPENSDAYGLLAVTFLNDPEVPDRLARAERYLRRALDLNPLSANARFHMGRLWLLKDNPQKAVVHLEEAALLQPMKWRPFYELKRAYERLGRKEKAREAGSRFQELRDLASEEDLLEKRCAVEKKNFNYHYRLGMIKLRKGDLALAGLFLRRAAEIKPKDPSATAALKAVGELMQGTAQLSAEVHDHRHSAR